MPRGWPPPVCGERTESGEGPFCLLVVVFGGCLWCSRCHGWALVAGSVEARVDVMHDAGPPVVAGDRFRTR